MSEYSTERGDFKIDNDQYSISLLNTQASFKLQFFLGNQVKFALGDKGIDPEVMWSLAEKLLKFATVNGYELDLEKHFFGKVEVLDRAVLEALKLNLPGFTKQLNVLLAQGIAKLSGLASERFSSGTSKSASAESAPASSQ